MSNRLCKSPCPGCGKTGYYGLKGTLCMDCNEAIKIGREVLSARQLAKNAPIGAFLVPWAWYAWPSFRHSNGESKYPIPGAKSEESKRGAADLFEWHWHALVELLGEPCHHTNDAKLIIPQQSVDSRSSTTTVTMRKDIVEHLRELYRFIEEMIENGYIEGRTEGENLIGRLASGDLSVRELNQKSINAGKKK